MGKSVKVESEIQAHREAQKKSGGTVAVKLQKQQQTRGSKKKKHNRIIIRNLVVDINEKHLKKLCQQYGNIVETSIPQHGVKKCGRGFAFVQFSKKNMCLKAIKELNGLNYKGRTIVVDMAVSKDVFEQAKGQNQKGQQASEPMDVEIKEQPTKIQEEAMPEKVQQQKGQQDLSSTIFIRNLPYGTEESQVYDFFKKYGRVRFAKLVIDKDTEEPKGTAFVKFRELQPAQRLIQFSRDSDQPQYARKELDPSISLQFEGRILKVFPAESRESLTSKVQERDKPKQTENPKIKSIKKIKDLDTLLLTDKNNKRNLGLASEGICSAEDWMKAEDSDKFSKNHKEKLQRLKNPNNFVSPTRIILKYLDRSVTEEQLKDICHEYIRQAWTGRHRMVTFQCKLMLDQTRTKSIGIAFIEFAKPEASLGFIRWVRQQRKRLFPQKNSILIEFVIQDARKMQIIRKKIKKTK